MKDPLGHGSNANRADFAHNKIAISSGARFHAATRPAAKPSTNDRVAELRTRLSAPKTGLAQTFLNGVKNALRG